MIYYFILGILFIDIILPLLEGVTGCICTRMEQYKAKCALEITKINENIEDISNPEPPYRAMGFQYIPTEEEELDD